MLDVRTLAYICSNPEHAANWLTISICAKSLAEASIRITLGCQLTKAGVTPFATALILGQPDLMNHVKIFKGWSLQDAPAMLVQLCYKSLPPGRFLPGGNEEATVLSNKRSTA